MHALPEDCIICTENDDIGKLGVEMNLPALKGIFTFDNWVAKAQVSSDDN